MNALREELKKYASEERRKVNIRFFKTGKGEYGEGDQFIGVTVPECRKVASTFLDTPIIQLKKTLHSPLHEERLVGLFILVEKYRKAITEKEKKKIVDFYLKNKEKVNNWDLVDLSAYKILGNYLLHQDKKILHTLAKSPSLWDRRIAILSTYASIQEDQFNDTFLLCEKFLSDKEDLMHKACGWMLREIGKRDEKALETFLKKHHLKMPRTMLRYSIERFPKNKREKYLLGTA
ncbi:MAG: DNA alkylation repair protein [Candidatus Diapherotrites archaeon]